MVQNLIPFSLAHSLDVFVQTHKHPITNCDICKYLCTFPIFLTTSRAAGACYLACHYTSADCSKTKRDIPTGLPPPSPTYCLPVSHRSPHEQTQHSSPCVLTSHGETLAAPATGLSVTRSLSQKCPNGQAAAYTSTLLGCSNAKQSIGMIQKLKTA